MFDNNRNVRDVLITILKELMLSDKKSFTPNLMKTIIGAWWMSTCDPIADIAMTAMTAFEAAIPPKKRESVLSFLLPSIFEYMQYVIDGSHSNDTLFKVFLCTQLRKCTHCDCTV